jgi:hypothetical protein
MAAATNALPYGMRDIKLASVTGTGDTIGSKVDLPAAQTFSWSDTEEMTELRGDDVIIAIHGKGPKVEWELEAGGISMAAFVLMSGGTLTLSGVAPNEIRKIAKSGTDIRPYFYAEGQAISDSGGDFHAKVFKCKADGALEGGMADGEFWISKASGSGIPNSSNQLYELIHNETTTAIS